MEDMMYALKRKDKDIDELLNKCADSEATGKSVYPGMTYEQGVQEGIRWVIGETDDNPIEA